MNIAEATAVQYIDGSGIRFPTRFAVHGRGWEILDTKSNSNER